MAIQNLLNDLGTEVTQQELLSGIMALLTAMHDKMPRVDANDRLVVFHGESNPTVNIAASQTVATVTTLSTLQYLSAQPSPIPAGLIAYGTNNAGVLHIYDKITVS